MLKKIIAACAIALFFACAPKDDGFVSGEISSSSDQVVGGISSNYTPSSSSIPSDDSSSSEEDGDNSSNSGEDNSSSSVGSTTTTVLITNAKQSELFKTYYYGYTTETLEDLKKFWNPECPTTSGAGDTLPGKPEKCQIDSTNTMLRNKLTTKDGDLHYDFPFGKYSNARGYVELKEYILKAEGDQAAVGLNVSTDESNPKDIGELGISNLNGTSAFIYRYSGGAHTFRIVSKTDGDFWYKEVSATANPSKDDTTTVRISASELVGMGSYAASEEKEGTPFDISKVAKFLWVVEYDAETASKNTGSLRIETLSAEVE